MGNPMDSHAVNEHGDVSNEGRFDAEKKSAQTTEYEMPSAGQRDAQALARLGKKPVLKVRLKSPSSGQ